MKKVVSRLIVLIMIAMLAVPAPVWTSAAPLPGPAQAMAATINFTILHTNDFHGNLQLAGSNPGMARVAAVVNGVRTAKGAENVLLFDAGDEMQGSLLSNLQQGLPTIAAFKELGYNAATFGNHEFDWGQTVLQDRVAQAASTDGGANAYPFLASNLVLKGAAADCTTAGWDMPTWVKPYQVFNVGPAGSQVKVGVIGVTSIETPYITIASATAGLCFKDPTASILHYYDEVDAASDVMVVISHLGNVDGGYGYGFTVYGDQTLATNLLNADKPVSLIIGGHSHTDLAAAQVITAPGKTAQITVAQAHYAGRKVGQADFVYDTATGTATVTWQRLTVATNGAEDPDMKALIDSYASDPAYVAKINELIGYTSVPLVRDYNGESLMGDFIQDAVYGQLNADADPANDVDMVFNNAGGIRADIIFTSTVPYTLTYGSLFSVLPFGNQTIVGDMTGAQIQDLLNQSATLFKGALQPGGIKYKFYSYRDALPGPQPWAWGAYDITVLDKATQQYIPLDVTKTYRVATNEFLAPAGQDGFTPFKYMTNISYYGDMLDTVNAYVKTHFETPEKAYTATLDQRIVRDGTDAAGSIIPLTVLHHNDSHGNLVKGTYVGYTQLATLIKQERAHNPDRTLLLSSGDNIQGDAMMYYYRTAPQGFDAEGVALPTELMTHPLMAAFNAMNYDAYTLGNHEFNFGSKIFTSTLQQANFPVLQANIADSGAYGLSTVPVQPYVEKTVGVSETIKVAILGIGNHRIPNYELPSNIPGLSFTNPISTAKSLAPGLKTNDDVVIALTHIGFTTNPKSVEVDNNVDTALAAQTSGIDVVIGGHSHTDPSKGEGAYKYLPAVVSGPNNTPVLVTQAYRYNNYLGEVVIGLRAKQGGGYEVVSRAGRYNKVDLAGTPEDPAIKALLQPYVDRYTTYNTKQVGQTTQPIDTMQAFTQETNGGNLQADASVFELAQHNVNVDFHISGAMTNKIIAPTAAVTNPVTVTIADMFAGMPYENSLVTMNMNGPQIKKVLERSYRNYFYYKYYANADPKYGGYSYYTTCFLDINKLGQIKYNDTYPALPNGNNVVSLTFEKNGSPVTIDFNDAATLYHVSTVNYLAAGSCNMNDNGVTLWPLDQIVSDNQLYVRDATIHYIQDQQVVTPTIEGRVQFITDVISPTVELDLKPAIMTDIITATFTFTGTDIGSGIRHLECSLDGADFAACTSPKTYTGLEDGSHTFEVRAVDMGNNVGPAVSYTWLLDTLGPVTTITASPLAASNAITATFAFTATDGANGSGVDGYACKLDSGAWGACGSPRNYTGLADGSHTFNVRSTDVVGNVGAAAVFTWTLDTVVPVTPVVTAPSAGSTVPFGPNYNTPTFTGTGEAGGTVEVWLKGAAARSAADTLLCSTKVAEDGTWSCKSTVALPSGQNNVVVTIKDAAGNTASTQPFKLTVLFLRYLSVITTHK